MKQSGLQTKMFQSVPRTLAFRRAPSSDFGTLTLEKFEEMIYDDFLSVINRARKRNLSVNQLLHAYRFEKGFTSLSKA